MKMEELKKLGVPCAFIHKSWRPKNYRILIQGQAQEILDKINSCDESQEDTETAHDSNISFPSLLAPLQEFNKGEP